MNRRETLALLSQFDIRPIRSLGQNFLTDERIAVKICAIADLQPADLVIEIGPGIGSLTRELASRAGRVIALEIDRYVLPALRQVMAGAANCTILQGDALAADLGELAASHSGPVKVVANLPYYITTPLIVKMIKELPKCMRLVLMIQKEAAGRVMSGTGSKQYGPLAIMAACFGETSREMLVPADAFFPKPGVASCVLRLERNNTQQIADWAGFHHFLENCFTQRRRMLVNSLRIAGLDSERQKKLPGILSELQIAPDIRAEMVKKEELVAIYRQLFP